MLVRYIVPLILMVGIEVYFSYIMAHSCPLDEYPTVDDCKIWWRKYINAWLLEVFVMTSTLLLLYHLAKNK